MLNKEEEKKTIEAVVNAGEVEHYTKDFFKNHGKRGNEIRNKKYGKKGLTAIAKKAWETKRKLSTPL